MESDSLAIVKSSDRHYDIIEKDLRESFSQHGLLQCPIDQSDVIFSTHSVQKFLHTGKGVAKLLVLIYPTENNEMGLDEI